MPPLALDDHEIQTIIECAKVVPQRLRKKYHKSVVERLSDDDGDVEKVISSVLARLDGRAALKKN